LIYKLSLIYFLEGYAILTIVLTIVCYLFQVTVVIANK